MVFSPDSAPRTRSEFMIWYQDQITWAEEHSYDDPGVASDNLKNWFMEMITTFPAINGPYADDDLDSDYATDYSIGKDAIYVAFAWSVAEMAYEVTKDIAEKHNVGFFDVSTDDGDILFPDNNGKNRSIDRFNNLSSIQKIKNLAQSGQEDKSIKEIFYSDFNLEAIIDQATTDTTLPKTERKWWQKLLGLK